MLLQLYWYLLLEQLFIKRNTEGGKIRMKKRIGIMIAVVITVAAAIRVVAYKAEH